MIRILNALFVLIGVAAVLILASIFVRIGEHDEVLATHDLLAMPVPSWCIPEIKRFSEERLRDAQSRLIRVEHGLMRYPHVAAVLVIRPSGEMADIPRLAYEELHRHCAIREEYRFSGPAAFEQAMQSIKPSASNGIRYFVVGVDASEETVHVVPLPDNQ